MRHKEAPSFFILAGEPSGDIHGKKLIAALQKIYFSPSFKGVGGPLMRAEGLVSFFPMEELTVMGFQEIIIKLPALLKKMRYLKNRILEEQPDACILIDFPDFNLTLARLLRRGGYTGKIIQMIPPTVWAWRKGRIKTLEKNFDLLLSIYPFEKEIYKETSLPVAYIGNPIFDEVKSHAFDPHFREKAHIKEEAPLISLFPGSRKSEVKRNLPKQLEVLQALGADLHAFSFAIATDSAFFEEMQPIIDSFGFRNRLTHVTKDKRYDLMRASDMALAKSGTVTLELALNLCPTVVTYELSWANFMFAKYIARIKLAHFSIANILLQEEVLPEHIADGAPVKAVTQSVKSLLFNAKKREETIEKQKRLHQVLQGEDFTEAIEKAVKGLFP
jgi:lipid-A-disaccharide synthase